MMDVYESVDEVHESDSDFDGSGDPLHGSGSESDDSSDNGFEEEDDADQLHGFDSESDDGYSDNGYEEEEEEEEEDEFEAYEEDSPQSHSRVTSLASLYRPPYEIMHGGGFHQAKEDASRVNKWLLVNIQSRDEFKSHLLNRDTWSNDAVVQMIRENLVFFQAYDDNEEGMKVKTYYNLASVPAVLILNPITGQKMKLWSGVMIDPDTFLEYLIPFIDKGPKEELEPVKRKIIASSNLVLPVSEVSEEVEHTKTNDEECWVFLPLPEEPKITDGNHVCRIGMRFPDGRRLQRNFFQTDPIQLLWPFCRSQLKQGEAQRRFKLMIAAPAVRILDYESKMNFVEAGLPNTMISVGWDSADV